MQKTVSTFLPPLVFCVPLSDTKKREIKFPTQIGVFLLFVKSKWKLRAECISILLLLHANVLFSMTFRSNFIEMSTVWLIAAYVIGTCSSKQSYLIMKCVNTTE